MRMWTRGGGGGGQITQTFDLGHNINNATNIGVAEGRSSNSYSKERTHE